MESSSDGRLEVVFFENAHVQDEVGGLRCEPSKADAEGVFCREPIQLDRNLGTGNDTEEMVHTFDFSCRIDS